MTAELDSALAYEKHAREFLEVRDASVIGAEVVDRWARSLPPGIEVLDIACGGGLPITQALVDAGLSVRAMDASPTLVAEFHARFPDVPVECSRIQDSRCFDRRFGAVTMIGLIFLLNRTEQEALIARIPEMLLPGGRFLMTAPIEAGRWADLTTGIESLSLGKAAYEEVLKTAGLSVIDRYRDEGNGNYYDAEFVDLESTDGARREDSTGRKQ